MNSPSSKPRILVIDDEPDLRTLYELSLMKMGYTVITESTFGAAKLAIESDSYDAIISDMRLPDGLGIDLLPLLQTLGRQERCIIITAYGSQDGAVEALKAGAFDYLSKPVDIAQLRTIVAAAVAEKTQTNTTAITTAASPEPTTQTAQPEQPTQQKTVKTTSAPVSAPVSTTKAVTKEKTDTSTAPTSAPPTAGDHALGRIVGISSCMQAVRERIAKVARGMAPVFIRGESGTGKELVANAVHACSQRSDGPFVAVNCGAIPESLLEAEFFGAKKGAYTGATSDREGVFQAAAGGTLFLDEIGDLPLSMQAKLLRAIQERKVRPLGETQELPVDVRIVSATHHDLAANVQAGLFRQDLFYRLNVIDINLPPLRDRREDLPFLCNALLDKITKQAGLEAKPLSQNALMQLMQHPLTGNVRELENLLQRALALSDGSELEIDSNAVASPSVAVAAAPAVAPVTPPSTPPNTTPPASTTTAPPPVASSAQDFADIAQAFDAPQPKPDESTDPLPRDLQAYLDDIERDILIRTLREYDFNRTAAAEHLGISLRQMRYRIKQLDITEQDCR